MLQRYTMEGFLSAKNCIEVDLRKTQYHILERTNVKDGILKGCMFVGGNASGKTNLIEGLRFLLIALFTKVEINWDDYLCLFSDSGVFDNTYVFETDGNIVQYQLRYQKKEKLLIERLQQDSMLLLDRIGSSAKTVISERKEFNDVPENAVFLRELWFNTRFRGFKVLQKWFEFLLNSKHVNPLERSIFANEPTSDIRLADHIKENGVDDINAFLMESGFDYFLVYNKGSQQDTFSYADLYVKRKGIDKLIPFSIESMGNRILMMILPAYLSVIKNGGMLICDEFSSGLHNDLEELLVKYFMKHANNAQIFIVSHSTNLLTSSIFRPDQLYAVNFDAEGSNIIRFSSEQPRTGQNYEKMYLGGVFSGLPQYNEI